jgi:sulfatase modifying factor 1
MKAKFLTSVRSLFVLSTVLCAALQSTLADDAGFFRIVGPTETIIIEISPDGYITFSNAQDGATYTVQTDRSLGAGTNWVDYVQIPASNNVVTLRLFDPRPPTGMMLIPAGSFAMGDCMDPPEGLIDEYPRHTVYVSAFHMDRYLVTSNLWNSVKSWNGGSGYIYDYDGSGQAKATNHPVVGLSWYDAVRWCNARSQMEGLTPCYYMDAGLTIVFKHEFHLQGTPYVNWDANGYRLPTEAEWEKAARGGASGHRFPWSNVDTISHSQANYYSDSPNTFFDINPTRGYHPAFNDGIQPYTSPVGYFAANGYGLYDMAGNVSEWCWDWYDTAWYSNVGATQSDTRGPSSGGERMVRGGSWFQVSGVATVACRLSHFAQWDAPNVVGFRCVRGH